MILWLGMNEEPQNICNCQRLLHEAHQGVSQDVFIQINGRVEKNCRVWGLRGREKGSGVPRKLESEQGKFVTKCEARVLPHQTHRAPMISGSAEVGS